MNRQTVVQSFPIISFGFIKSYIITMRPYLLFVSGITGIAGMSFISNLSLGKLAALFLASFFSYGFGQALTDCFQIDTDKISSPYRPLTQGKISKETVLIISILGLTLCISVFSIYNIGNLLFGVLGGFGLYTYTYFKKKWWAGPYYNAFIVLLLFLMSANSGEFQLTYSFRFQMCMIAVFFGYANFVISGYFKDIKADSITGYYTLPVVYGKKISALVSDVFAVLTIIPTAVIVGNSPFITNVYAWLVFLAATALMIYGQYSLHKVKEDEEAHKAITPILHSYILLLASVAIVNKPEWIASLLSFYILFLLIMKTRPAKNQV